MKTREEIVELVVEQMYREVGGRPLPEVSAAGARAVAVQIARSIVAAGVPYLIAEGGKAIMCFNCGLISHNPNDVEKLYCGNCHIFHEA